MSHEPDIPIADLQAAAARPEIVEAMHTFYAEADRLIAEQPGTCFNKGVCCQFGLVGHRLYVTTLEAAYYLAADEPIPPITDDACPHAHHGKCHARERRPLGCRIYYCDPAAKDWQAPLTEQLLTQLRTMHEQLAVQYLYADWMTILRALNM